ncbi:hypothetical protein DID88_004519 [Monilinia fructigena]|uniref:Uncharacterized protein n=1 Tax=Monilinia fructigena TaxID=38457 RepID=A0A395IRI0_9HELO|nr:hypothetical protein DID88_004519 [Monilinia fructigena]
MAVENVIYSHEAGPREENGEQGLRSPEQDNVKKPTAHPANKDLNHFPIAEIPKQLQKPSPTPYLQSSLPSDVFVNEPLSRNANETPLVVQDGNRNSESFYHSENVTSQAEDSGIERLPPPQPISKTQPSHDPDVIPEERVKNHRKPSLKDIGEEKVLRLSAAEMTELTSAPDKGDTEGQGHKRSGSDVPRVDPDDQPPKLTGHRNFDTSEINGDRQSSEGVQSNTGTKRPPISSSSRAFSAQPPSTHWPSYSKLNAGILISWWGHVLAKECRFITGFVYHGTSRMWQRRNERRSAESLSPNRSMSRPGRPSMSATTSYQSQAGRPSEAFRRSGTVEPTPRVNGERRSRQGWGRRHRRMKSQPSSLSSYNKADILQGAVIIFSSFFLMKLDASRMYHSIRAQSAIRLYVIYNLLEVFDRLAAALGQDIFECLFSDETLERDSDGRSRVLRPLGMFVLALIYNVVHAAALFTQVVTLNVAVNSYSNALITLLLSNQFVEVKGTVFKKFEKDNLFQLTCADVVERFQLWLMLTIIALRNIVEMGGFSSMASSASEATSPLRTSSMLPNSFTILPVWSGEVFSPFFIVIGSEMLVDWIKHAYISKFNGVKPAIYQRFLDVLAKDYYTNAFVNQNLIKRLGLPVIPLSCLFIRAAFQTYHMFLATHLPPPLPSTATSLSVESSPATTAALEHFDTIVRKALSVAQPLVYQTRILPHLGICPVLMM